MAMILEYRSLVLMTRALGSRYRPIKQLPFLFTRAMTKTILSPSYMQSHVRTMWNISEQNRLRTSRRLPFVKSYTDMSLSTSGSPRHHSSRAESQRLNTKRYLWTAVSVIVGLHIIVFIYIQYERRKRRVHQQEKEGFEIFQDPYMSNDAKMMNYKGTWFPYQLYVANGCDEGFKAIEDFPVTDDDIFVASFPKSGTTWLQQIVDTIVYGEEHIATMEDRFPYMEYIYPGIKELSKRKSPRHIKTHLPYRMLPKHLQQGQGKVLYIARNPKDVCVSLYFFSKMLSFCNYAGDMSDMYESFLQGRVNYGPWWCHVLDYWKHRNQQNILFITYEDLHREPEISVQRIANFLGYNLNSSAVKKVVQNCHFEKMKDDPNSNYSWWDDLGIRNKKQSKFMRKGKVGDWKNYFTDDMNKRMDQQINKELETSGLNFIDQP